MFKSYINLKKYKKINFFLLPFYSSRLRLVEEKFNQMSELKTRNVPPTKFNRILLGTLTINMQILKITNFNLLSR